MVNIVRDLLIIATMFLLLKYVIYPLFIRMRNKMKKQPLQHLHDPIFNALDLIPGAEADALIGAPPPRDYQVLIKAMDACGQASFMLAITLGMRRTAKAKKQFAQTGIVLLQLMHFAYALGVKHGRKL